MTQPTLYPHEVVAKWIETIPVVTICLTTLISGATILLFSIVIKNILIQPDMNSAYYSQQVTAPMVSVNTPIPIIVGCVFIMIGMYFSFNLLSRGELV